MGSEQSMPPKQQPQRAPPVRRGYTVAGTSFGDGRRPDTSASGNNSPGASMCSDSELPYISYTVDRPIGDSPKHASKQQRDGKKPPPQKRQSAAPRRAWRARGIVVVKTAADAPMDEHVRRLQEIPTFLPIMRGTLGLPGARDPEVLEGLEWRGWARLCCRLQAHLAASAHPLAAAQAALLGQLREADAAAARAAAAAGERQRANARHAERLARARHLAHTLRRARDVLAQTLHDAAELNQLLPPEKRLEPFVWDESSSDK